MRGFEFERKGNLTRELEIVAGYSHLDPRVTKSIDGYRRQISDQHGARIRPHCGASTPGTTARSPALGSAPAFAMSARTYGDDGNTFVIPAYTLFDATISYDFAYLRPD